MRVPRPVQRLIAESDPVSVMACKEKIAIVERVISVGRQHIHRQHITGRLGHLPVVDDQKLAVQPVIGPTMAVAALGLSDLVRMMDRHMVDPAAVDIETLAQIFRRHGGALDVPARKAGSPGGVPLHDLIGIFRLREPKREIRLMSLSLIGLHPIRRLLFIEPKLGEIRVARESRHLEVDITATLIGEARLNQSGDKIDHLLNMLGRPADRMRTQNVQHVGVTEERLLIGAGRYPTGSSAHGPAASIILSSPESASDWRCPTSVTFMTWVTSYPAPASIRRSRSSKDIGPHIADMGEVVDGRSARIDAGPARLERLELLDRTAGGVEQADG